MRGGFKQDRKLTRALFENGFFRDRRSKAAYDSDINPHFLLEGQDKIDQCMTIRAKAKTCAICGQPIVPENTEVDHYPNSGNYRRCDCRHNLRAVHRACHRERHPHTKF